MSGKTLRYLSRADVEAVGLTSLEVVDILEAAFRAKRAGDVEMPPKVGVHPREDAFIHAMPAYLADTDAVGRLASVGADPGDDEDTRAGKALLVLISVLILPVALLWSILYLAFGSPVGFVPLVYFAVLLGAIALGRTWFGVLLVLAYGLGMAAMLTVAGLLLVKFSDKLENWSSDRLRQRMRRVIAAAPVLTAGMVMVVGMGLTVRAVMG